MPKKDKSSQSHFGRARRSRTTTQQSLHRLQRDAPNSHINCPSPSTITTPIYYTHPLTDLTHHPERHPYPFSHFATVHFPDIQTQTDRWDKRQVYSNSAYALLIVSDALIIDYTLPDSDYSYVLPH